MERKFQIRKWFPKNLGSYRDDIRYSIPAISGNQKINQEQENGRLIIRKDMMLLVCSKK